MTSEARVGLGPRGGEMMRRAWIGVLALGWAAALAPGESGQSLLPTSLRAPREPLRAAPVPPSQEIEMLDPAADPTGNPAVELVPSDGDRLRVDIPRLVLVHKYYYTGDRSFQFKLMPGGPCTVVVDHPRTGERLYLQATLPPGAPRVYYDAGSIEYDYGAQGVKILFGTGRHGPPKIVYRQGTRSSGLLSGLTTSRGTRMKEAGERIREEANAVNRIDGGPEPERRFGDRTRRLLAGARKGVRDAARAASDRASQAIGTTPAAGLVDGAHEEAVAERAAERARATEPAALDAQPTVERDF